MTRPEGAGIRCRFTQGEFTIAMKKAEMEEHAGAYDALMASARLAESQGLYRVAVDAAIAAWEHIDGMMQYGIKYEKDEFTRISAIETVLKYAPLLFDFQNLDALEQLLETRKRIEKNTSVSVVDKLATARAQMWDNHRLWGYLEKHGEVRQDQLRELLGGNQDQWRWLAESWSRMGLVKRMPEGGSYRLSLSTRMGQVVSAKCPSCGKISEAPRGCSSKRWPVPNAIREFYSCSWLLKASLKGGLKSCITSSPYSLESSLAA
jgi:hypothetical protein